MAGWETKEKEWIYDVRGYIVRGKICFQFRMLTWTCLLVSSIIQLEGGMDKVKELDCVNHYYSQLQVSLI